MMTFSVREAPEHGEALVYVGSDLVPDDEALFLAFKTPRAAEEAAKFFNQLARMQHCLTYPGKR